MIEKKNIKRTIVTQNKLDRAYKYGMEVGLSKNPHRNKCLYNNFQLRQRWFQGYEKAFRK